MTASAESFAIVVLGAGPAGEVRVDERKLRADRLADPVEDAMRVASYRPLERVGVQRRCRT